MGLFSSSRTKVVSNVDGSNTSNVTVNPLTNVAIQLDNSSTANAIAQGFGALAGLGESLGGGFGLLGSGISQSGGAIGSGIEKAGSNLAFALLAGASLYALTR